MSTTFYKKIFAWVVAHNIHRYNRYVSEEKSKLFSCLCGNILEIGAGTGINIQYFRTDIKYIGLEPNIAMHKYLQAEIYKRGLIEARIVSNMAESLPFGDKTIDTVLCTLVLCSVKNTDLVLQEVRRVLKPDGCFIFIEHVAAQPNTTLRMLQHMLKWPWKIIADGCDPEKDTAEIISRSGFTDVQILNVQLPLRSLVSPHIIGIAKLA